MSDNAMREFATAFASSTAHCFVDSGAFAAFRAGKRGEPRAIDFSKVLARYDALAHAVCAATDDGGDEAMWRVHFVMPDVVGDQDATLDVLRAWADEFAYFGHAIVPLQSGARSLTVFYDEVCKVLGVTGLLRVGVPSAEAAASDGELLELLVSRDVYAVHILGAAGNKRATARLDTVAMAGFDGDVSLDANRLRGYWNKFSTRREALARLLAGLAPKRRADLTEPLFKEVA